MFKMEAKVNLVKAQGRIAQSPGLLWKNQLQNV